MITAGGKRQKKMGAASMDYGEEAVGEMKMKTGTIWIVR
jgi:hypothetical protein